jgi:hypothetical protein
VVKLAARRAACQRVTAWSMRDAVHAWWNPCVLNRPHHAWTASHMEYAVTRWQAALRAASLTTTRFPQHRMVWIKYARPSASTCVLTYPDITSATPIKTTWFDHLQSHRTVPLTFFLCFVMPCLCNVVVRCLSFSTFTFCALYVTLRYVTVTLCGSTLCSNTIVIYY